MRNIAIVRPPSESFCDCLSSHPLRNDVDIHKAREQHSNYCRVLESLGLEVILLESNDSLPDSCFVEDTAVVRGSRSFITRMAVPTRRGEETAVGEVLSQYSEIGTAEDPGTIEGGDVVHLPTFLLVGLGQRSNREGARQLSEFLKVRIETIEDSRIFHLKSDMTYLGSDTFLTTAYFSHHEALRNFRRLVVPDDEHYAANTLTIGDTVLMSSRHKRTLEMVKKAGFRPLPLDVSEFEKCDGALTCLSIIL